MIPNQSAAANRRPALRLTMTDNLNIFTACHARGPAVAELGSLGISAYDARRFKIQGHRRDFLLVSDCLALHGLQCPFVYRWLLCGKHHWCGLLGHACDVRVEDLGLSAQEEDSGLSWQDVFQGIEMIRFLMPNHALQRTRRERRGCNSRVPWAGSLSFRR